MTTLSIIRYSVFGILVTSCALQAASPSAEEIGKRQQNSVAKIKTLRVKALSRIDYVGQDAFERPTLTLRKGDVCMIQEGIVGNRVVNRLTEEKLTRVVQRGWGTNGKIAFNGAMYPPNTSAGLSDLYTFLEFKYFHPSNGEAEISPADYYSRGDLNCRVHSENFEGRPCYRVDVSYDSDGTTYKKSRWHDVGYGYLVTRSTIDQIKNGNLLTTFVATMSDWMVAGDICFPKKIVNIQSLGDQLACTHTISCSEVELNGLIQEAELKLPSLPAKMKCKDFRTMKEYTVSSDWSRSGPESDLVVLQVGSGSSGNDVGSGGQATQGGERRSIWFWIAYISAVILILTFGWIGAVKWRRRKSGP